VLAAVLDENPPSDTCNQRQEVAASGAYAEIRQERTSQNGCLALNCPPKDGSQGAEDFEDVGVGTAIC